MQYAGGAWCLSLALLASACSDPSLPLPYAVEPPDAGGGAGGGDVPSGALSTERRYFLAIDDDPAPPVVLDLDKPGALALFGASAKAITVLEVDTMTMLLNALQRIRTACDPAPPHDCSKTPLGQSFGVAYQTSPGFALFRLLTTTPESADMTGTSLESLEHLYLDNPDVLAGTFAEFLAKSLGIATTATIIPDAELAFALQRGLLASHPRVPSPTGTLSISLDTALRDMTPLAALLGPVGTAPFTGPGEHPGVLALDDATFTTRSDALGPDFRMTVTARSNLRWAPGVALASGAGGLFYRTSGALLDFDFMDPAQLSIQGIAAAPTIDMRVRVAEHAGVVPSCTDVPACQSNFPPDWLPLPGQPAGAPVGSGTVWTLPRWTLESLVTRAALQAYGAKTDGTICEFRLGATCLVGITIGGPGTPPGWTGFISDFQSVPVPQDQFLWELLDEVTQGLAHDPDRDGVPDIPEGGLDAVLPLHRLDIGLDRAAIEANLRAQLQAQARLMGDLLLGRYWQRSDPVDLYYRRAGAGGEPFVFFVAPSDLRPGRDPRAPRPYAYERPGLFASPDLAPASKVSATSIEGVADTEHEKLRLPAGWTTVYAEDERGHVHEVRFHAPPGPSPLEIACVVEAL